MKMIAEIDYKSEDGPDADSVDVIGLKSTIMLEKFNYEIARWIAHAELMRQTTAVDTEIKRHYRLRALRNTSIFGAFSDYMMGGDAIMRENQTLLIDEYWSPVSIDIKYRGLTNQQIKSVLVLQSTFRTWIILKKYREILKMKAPFASKSFEYDKTTSTALYIQSSIKRVIAKGVLEARIVANKARDKSFSKFCCLMEEGVMITMFSRKYGTAPLRKISFDFERHNLTFSTSFGTRGKIPLRSIYKIHNGISETMYPHAREAQLSRCICLECLGERVVDMELSSSQQARDMYFGFERLIQLLSGTTSPFYVDNFGIPRRGGASVIENAINESHYQGDQPVHPSQPDEMRFWGAIRLLQQEYDIWKSEQDSERSAHIHKKVVEAERVADRLKLFMEEKLILDSAKESSKTVKLQRFVNKDGIAKMTEEGAYRADQIDLRNKLSQSHMCAFQGRYALSAISSTIKSNTGSSREENISFTKLYAENESVSSENRSEKELLSAMNMDAVKGDIYQKQFSLADPLSQHIFRNSSEHGDDSISLTGKPSSKSSVSSTLTSSSVSRLSGNLNSKDDKSSSSSSFLFSRILSTSGSARPTTSSTFTAVQSVWRAILCFAAAPIPEDPVEINKSTLLCGVSYQPRIFHSNRREYNNRDDDDDDDDDDDGEEENKSECDSLSFSMGDSSDSSLDSSEIEL